MDFCCVQIPEERNDLITNGFKAAGITEAAEKANKFSIESKTRSLFVGENRINYQDIIDMNWYIV